LPLSDGGTARITIAKWLTPNERTIDKLGLTPDITATLTQEDLNAGRDPQLYAALRVFDPSLPVDQAAIPAETSTSSNVQPSTSAGQVTETLWRTMYGP
jgi:hypothetical protein